jgi:hypothetical protein
MWGTQHTSLTRETSGIRVWESRPTVLYIQHPHSSTQQGAFYKGQTMKDLHQKRKIPQNVLWHS